MYCGIYYFAIYFSPCIYCLKERKEIILLLSLGEKKKHLIIQAAIEVGVQLVVSLMISLPLALIGVRRFGVWLFDLSVSDRNSILADSLRYSFSTNDITITYEQIQSLLKVTPEMLWILSGLIVLILLICIFISYKMIQCFHPRERMAGED